jgi:tRNA pseudouridine55 synthase
MSFTQKAAISGYILLNKETGVTSFGALNNVKKALSTSKVGHTGTLDKFASGLLLVLTGKSLKLAQWFSGSDKYYEGTIEFGAETDTLDPEGLTIAQAPIPSKEALVSVLPQFRGDILQEPPVYSALHIDGERASSRARSGETVEMKKRPVSIYSLELVSYKPPFAVIRVHCSKGAYIRSLARDIALAIGSRAYLAALNRTQIAGFRLSDAVSSNDLNAEAVHPIEKSTFEALGLPHCIVSEETARDMAHGRKMGSGDIGLKGEIKLSNSVPPPTFSSVGVFQENGNFVGIIEKQNGLWRYGYVYASN